MKKILYALMVFSMALITACSNEDITITSTGKTFTLTYSVNTKNLYEKFLISNGVQELLRENSFEIGVYTFIYDDKGSLVTQKFSHTPNYNNVVEEIVLTEGDYSIVSVETLVDPDNDFEPWYWEFEGVEKMSTLAIKQLKYELMYPYVLGYSTQRVSIANNVSITDVPQPIGSLIDVYFENFDESSYLAVGFATYESLDSYRLDPALNRDDRFNIDLASKGYINLKVETKIENDYFNRIRYILQTDIDYSYAFKEEEGDIWSVTSKKKARLEDGKVYYGGFYYISITHSVATFFGNSAEELNTWRKDVLDYIESLKLKTPILPEVYTTWGGSVSEAQSLMSGYTMTDGEPGKAIYISDGDYVVEYEGQDPVLAIGYHFYTETVGLYETDIVYDKTKIGIKDILTILNDKYVFMFESDGIYFYATEDYSAIIGLINNEVGYFVCYIDPAMMGAPAKKVPFKMLNNQNFNFKNFEREFNVYEENKGETKQILNDKLQRIFNL